MKKAAAESELGGTGAPPSRFAGAFECLVCGVRACGPGGGVVAGKGSRRSSVFFGMPKCMEELSPPS